MTNKTAYTVLFFSYPIYTAKPPPLASFSQCTISQKKKAESLGLSSISSLYYLTGLGAKRCTLYLSRDFFVFLLIIITARFE